MPEIHPPGLLEHLADLPDPRSPRGVRHKLTDIVCVSLLAVICGANTFADIHQYALAHRPWLETFLELPSGVPSQDTFERLFAALNPAAWQGRFLAWTRSLCLPELGPGEDEVLAVDGKTARGSRVQGTRPLHTVSVWSSQYEIVLARAAVDNKENEIVVLPELLETVGVAGAVVTTDAMGCQKSVAWAVREHHGHYLLALKDNHPKLAEDVRWLFEHAEGIGWDKVEHSHTKTFDKGHGREETRECWVLTDLEIISGREAWRDLAGVARVRSTRVVGEQTSREDRYYLTSLPCDSGRVLRASRLHWGIENGLHWVLDVAFDEDGSRARIKNTQANLVAVRHLALGLLKRDTMVKAGVKAKRLRAGWDRAYLLKLLES